MYLIIVSFLKRTHMDVNKHIFSQPKGIAKKRKPIFIKH